MSSGAITVTISGRNPKELVRVMRELVSEWEGFVGLESPGTAPSQPVKEAEKRSEPELYEPPTADVVAVRGVLSKLMQAGKQAQVQQILREYGGAEKLSDVPEDKLGAVKAAAEALL